MYTPFVTTHYTLFGSIIKSDNLVDSLQKKELKSCVIVEENNLGSCVEASKTLKAGGIKPILACSFQTSFGKETLIAKNRTGWRNLVKIHNSINQDGLVDTLTIKNSTEGLIAIIGGRGSLFNNLLAINDSMGERLVKSYIEDFGNENIFIGINSNDDVNANLLRSLSTTHHVSPIAFNQTRYLNEEDFNLYKIMLGVKENLTLNRLSSTTNQDILHILKHNKHFLSAYENTEEELKNSLLLSDMCDGLDLTDKPKLPHFKTDCDTEIEYIKKYSKQILESRKDESWNMDVYNTRLERELGVLEKAGLGGYFLIVQDYINYARKNGQLVGPGRGSSSGALIAYLMDIVKVNPIKHDLLFERFYNDGRNTADRVSYPDIDVDFPINFRDKIVSYIRNKYGVNHTSQISTYGSLKGRGALTEVLRITGACDNFTIKRITENLPEEHKISDKLEEDDETSIINWTLNNEPKILEEYCVKDDNGELLGDYSQYFKQAIKLEGTYKSIGTHAAGVVITSENLLETCPMSLDEHGSMKSILDMKSMEDMGLIKFDILGLATLDKLMLVNDLLQGKTK